jgi:hypothetical protein
MALCPQCGGRMARLHRAFFQKLLYSDRFRCPKCKARTGRFQPFFANAVSSLRFVFSKWSRCPRCESYGVYRLNRRDKIDSFSSNPVALFQFLLGAPINKCPLCRLHFYDWREPRPQARAPERTDTNQTASGRAAYPSSPNR